ncbi:MAG: hypothetical protein COA43_08600 [Robiginitomaculum sp.]|nr:MAG: hypothetical protein COA43_08600 [Robiginitomaculum sp.]
MRVLILSFMCWIATGCTVSELARKGNTLKANEIVFFVKDKTVSCQGVVVQECLQVMRKPKGHVSGQLAWELFYDQIQGFTFVAGYEYELIIREIYIPMNEVPADAPSIRYELVREVRKILTYRP